METLLEKVNDLNSLILEGKALEALEENKKRVEANPDYYRLRQQITEHQFGALKRQWGFTFTLMKGKQNVLSEVNLMMTVYNLRRLMSIFSVNELKNKLKELAKLFLMKYVYCKRIQMI